MLDIATIAVFALALVLTEPITCWLERLPDRLRRWRQTWRR